MAKKTKMTYEELVKANQEIVAQLRKGKLSPNQAIKLIEEAGVNLELAQQSLSQKEGMMGAIVDDIYKNPPKGRTAKPQQDFHIPRATKFDIESIPVDMRTGVLRFDHIKKNFGTKKVLKDITCEFEPGHVYGFLGNNGAGKTTMMRILFNMENLTGGDITYKVKTLNNDGSIGEKIIKHGDIDYSDWFYFTETDAVPTNYTVHNYLQELAFLYDMPQAEFSYREREIMTFLDVNFKLDMKIASLSSGQQKIVSCIALLLVKPNIVFLDEPTANMDVWNQQIIMKIINRMKNENRIIVITTHLLKETKDILTDAIIVDEGVVTHQCKVDAKTDLYKVFKENTTDSTETDFKDVDSGQKIKKTYDHNSFDKQKIGAYLND